MLKKRWHLVQSKRSVAYIYLTVASRTMVFDLSGNLSSPLSLRNLALTRNICRLSLKLYQAPGGLFNFGHNSGGLIREGAY